MEPNCACRVVFTMNFTGVKTSAFSLASITPTLITTAVSRRPTEDATLRDPPSPAANVTCLNDSHEFLYKCSRPPTPSASYLRAQKEADQLSHNLHEKNSQHGLGIEETWDVLPSSSLPLYGTSLGTSAGANSCWQGQHQQRF